MKKLVAILLLITFLLQTTSNLWIIVSFYIQRNHIAKNLCVNRFNVNSVCKGKCYLSKKLKENEKKKQNFPDLKQKEFQLYWQDLYILLFPKNFIDDKQKAFIDNFHSSGFIFSFFHPPQVV